MQAELKNGAIHPSLEERIREDYEQAKMMVSKAVNRMKSDRASLEEARARYETSQSMHSQAIVGLVLAEERMRKNGMDTKEGTK